MSQLARTLRLIAGLAALVALAGCAAPGAPSAADPLGEARAALSRGEHARAAELLVLRAGGDPEAALLLARARLDLARARLGPAPGDPAAQRAALDLVSLGLPLAEAEPTLHAELLALRSNLVELLAAEDERQAGAVVAATPAPSAPPAARPQQPSRPSRPQAPPAQPAPAYSVVRRTSHDGSGNSGAYASCIDVQVVAPGGPVAGAVIGINNGDLSYQNQTDGDGYAGRCGLGASTWSVVLFWTPRDGGVSGATTTLYVSGAPGQRASAVFQGR